MHDELGGLDLNLFVLFDALAEHRHVTTAAAKVGLSQSAASHALKRLRDAVGDPLFVRGEGGLLPTPRAEVLARSVRSALATLRHGLVQERAFHPASSRRSFRIGASDAFDILVLPRLIAWLGEHAPRIQLTVVRPDVAELGARLESGDLDVYFGVLPNQPAFEGLLPDPGERALRTAVAYEEGWVCLVRRGHPRVRRAPTPAQYAREQHVLFSPTGGGTGIVDRLLDVEGLSRHVTLRVSSFHSAVECVRSTDLLWTGPRRIAEALDPERALLHLRAPLDLPGYATRVVWHERFDHDPGHRWLRERIGAAAAR